jgi:hypothetical protein
MRPALSPELAAKYQGQWVAVKDRKIIAHAESSRGLIEALRRMGRRSSGATGFFVSGVTGVEP